MFKNKLIVASHRRSGTHLTIDILRHNFGFQHWINIDKMAIDHDDGQVSERDMDLLCGDSPCIIKTHVHGCIDMLSSHIALLSQQEIKQFFRSNPVVYAVRNVFDVLVSMYFYQKCYKKNFVISFDDFIRQKTSQHLKVDEAMTRPEYWSFHVCSWIKKPNVQLLSFAKTINDYHLTVKSISEYLGLQVPSNIVDVRRSVGDKKSLGQYTSVCFRKGVVGDSKNYFTNKSSINFVRDYAKEGMSYISNQINKSAYNF